jgi:hypothetical protein
MGSVDSRIKVQASPGINVRPSLKISIAKRTDGLAQVMECLPRKFTTLIQAPVPPNKGDTGSQEKRTNPQSCHLVSRDRD